MVENSNTPVVKLTFSKLEGSYSISRLAPDAMVPDWLNGPGLVSMTRATDELSIVCPSDRAPASGEHGWAALRVDTLADLDEPGVVMAAVTPISSAGFGVFVISTHLRDYILVREVELDAVCRTLAEAGHQVSSS